MGRPLDHHQTSLVVFWGVSKARFWAREQEVLSAAVE